MKILLATTNPGKIEEYRYIFKDWRDSQVFTLEDFHISEKPNETGETFAENSLQKAQFYCTRAAVPALGDDGGIEIDIFGGQPGVKTRRWLGHECTDEELIDYTLTRMSEIPWTKRGAQFRVVATLIFPDGKTFQGEGIQRGHIAEAQIRPLISGYPFRSIFIRDNTTQKPAQPTWEGEYSHRSEAVAKIKAQLIKARLL